MFPINKPFCRSCFWHVVVCAALVLTATKAFALIEITGVTYTYSQSCSGEIEVTATGNGGPFTIAWGQAGNQQVSNINGSYTIANLCPNANYSITVTNQYGCPKILGAYISLCNSYPEYTITQNTLVHSTAPGANQGSVDISVAVTGYPYTPQLYYKWTDQQGNVVATTQDLQHVGAGIYCVQVTSGCGQASKCFEVKDCSCPCPVGIEFDMNFQCSPGVGNGTLGARVVSEFPPFTYQWSGPAGFTSSVQKLYSAAEGNYCVTVTDKCGRTNTKCQNVKCCDAYEIPTISSAYECLGWEDVLGFWHSHDGHLEVALEPYHYNLSPECNAQYTLKCSVDNSENTVVFNTATNSWEGTTVKHITNPGNYCVTVTNNCGCARKSCRTFGAMGHYTGFEDRRLDSYLSQNVPGYSIGDFYDIDYPVLIGCNQCNACGMGGFTDVVGGPCDETGGQLDFFTYTDPNPYDDKPCSGGAINCFNNPPGKR